MNKKEIAIELSKMPNLVNLDRLYKSIDEITDEENRMIMIRNKNETTFFCTKCGQETIVPTIYAKDFKKGEKITCSHCWSRYPIIYKNNRIRTIEKYITYFESNERNELILRIFDFLKEYSKKDRKFHIRLLEVSRINIDRSVAMKNHSYRVMGSMFVHHGIEDKGWMIDRTEFYAVYHLIHSCQSTEEIKDVIKRTDNFKYSCLEYAIKNKFELLTYIDLYMKFPKLELLVKNGCKRLIWQMCGSSYINEHILNSGILNGLTPKELKFLCKHDLEYSELKLLWELKIFDVDLIKKASMIGYSTFDHKELNHRKTIEYLNNKQYLYRDYKDYIDWCKSLGKNMNDKKILFPDNPKQAHDETYEEKILFENQVFNEKIHEYAIEMNKYTYSNKELIIRPASSGDELVIESKELNHCVRTYAKRMSKRQTCIFFIRKIDDIDKPYCTLELQENHIIQCRAFDNKRPCDEALAFVRSWAKLNELECNL